MGGGDYLYLARIKEAINNISYPGHHVAHKFTGENKIPSFSRLKVGFYYRSLGSKQG